MSNRIISSAVIFIAFFLGVAVTRLTSENTAHAGRTTTSVIGIAATDQHVFLLHEDGSITKMHQSKIKNWNEQHSSGETEPHVEYFDIKQ